MDNEVKLPPRDETGRFTSKPKEKKKKVAVVSSTPEVKKVEKKPVTPEVEVKVENSVVTPVATSLNKDMYKRSFVVSPLNKDLPSFNFKSLSSSYYKLLASESNLISPLKAYVNGGENYLRQTSRQEVKAFDDTFINELETGLDAVAKILANPRTFIKEEADLVEAGLAKKISALSVQHFASHSQYIRDIDEDGNVTPEKILTIHAETDTAIYENRFVMTLIKKCLSFIQTRYWYVIEHGETKDSDLLLLHNKTVIDNVTYEVDSRIKISTPSLDNGNSQKNNDLLARLTTLRQRCAYFLRSPFMEEMKGAKDVASPIHMTNMLLKHPEYHKAYLLWIFLDKYEDLGISYEVKEFNQKIDQAYKDELSTYVANSILAIHSNRVNKDEVKPSKPYKYVPKVVFSLEDETYADSRFLFDAYPEAKKVKPYPLPDLPAEVALENERIRQRIKNQKAAKEVLDKAILDDKDKIIYEETLKRVEKQKALNNERLAYINEALLANAKLELTTKKIDLLEEQIKEKEERLLELEKALEAKSNENNELVESSRVLEEKLSLKEDELATAKQDSELKEKQLTCLRERKTLRQQMDEIKGIK